MVFQGNFKAELRRFQAVSRSFMGVLTALQECINGVLRGFQGTFKEFSRVCKKSKVVWFFKFFFKEVTRISKIGLRFFSGKFQGCFKRFSRVIKKFLRGLLGKF